MNKTKKTSQSGLSPEEELEICFKRLDEAERNAGLGSWEFDCKTGKSWWSKQLFRLFNLDISDAPPSLQENLERIHPDDRHLIIEVFNKMSIGILPPTPVFRSNPEFGNIKYFLPTVSIETEKNGKPAYFRGTQLDITERFLSEESMKISMEELIKFKESVEQSVDGIAISDLEGKITYVNIAWAKMHGYEKKDLVNKHLSIFHTTQQLEKEVLPSVEITQRTNSFSGEMSHKRKDGSTFPTMMSTTLLFGEDSKPFGMVAIARDITEIKRNDTIQESYLKLSEYAYYHTLDELLQRTLDVAEFLSDSCIGFYHFVDEDQKNLTLQTWSTNTLRNMCTASGKGSHYSIDSAGVWADCIRTGKPIIHNNYYNLPNKKGMPPGHAEVSREIVVPIYRNDKAVAIIGVGNKSFDYNENDLDTLQHFADLSWDVISRKQKEEEIIKLNEILEQKVAERTLQLESANRDLEAFAYSVSHDLRAPLRHIDGFSRLLQMEIKERTNEIDNYSSKISYSTKKMARMIDDLLTFSRLGRKSLNIKEVNLMHLIEKVINYYKPDGQERNIQWILNDLPIIKCDENMMQLAFQNLITNAIKYTSKKTNAVIEIGKCNKNGGDCIFIKDNGAGFDMRYADKLFGVFQRLHTNEEFEGTGIGLANIKQIINKHGWKVFAEGEIDKGATFYIKF